MGATAFIVATGIKAYGQNQAAKAQSQALQGQAAMGDYNAQVSKQNAEQAMRTSSSQQLQLRRNARQQIARERAFGAQSGTGQGGTNADLLEQSETLAELDALNVAYEGQLKASGYVSQSDMDAYSASLYRTQAKNVRRAGYLSTVGTLVSGYGQYQGIG